MIQLQVLNAILDRKDSTFISLNNITEEFFSDYKQEFEFINNHIQKYGVCPDKETFLTSFPNFDLIKVDEPNDYLVDELFDDRNKRALARVFNKIRSLINENKTDEAMKVYSSSADLILKAKHMNSIDILADTSRYDKYVDKINNFDDFYVSTGFKELDKVIGGWDRQEELATIIARSNVGKSWILLKTAVAAAEQGLNVGLYSGEMSDTLVGYRADTLISHLSNKALIHGNGDIQNDYKRFLESLSTKIKGHIRVLTPEMIGGLAGTTELRGFIEKDDLDMLCVDQHSLLVDDKHAKSPVERASNISRDLKTLQVLKKIPIIAVSQQNRQSIEDGINLTHISQSDRIGQDSTIVLALERKEDVLIVNLLKSRNSENSAQFKYAVDFDKGIFEYINIENDGLKGFKSKELKSEFDYDEEESVF